MKKLCFHLVGGAAGDMLLASLFDLGFSPASLRKELKKIPLSLSFQVKEDTQGHVPRKHICYRNPQQWTYAALVGAIKKSVLDQDIKRSVLKVYERIACVEKKVHRSKGAIHVHHLGQTDAVVEMCGFFIGLKHLGVEEVCVSTFPLSQPAPATLELLKNQRVRMVTYDYESVTPTAAALLVDATPCDRPFVYQDVGWGWGRCGDKDYLCAYVVGCEYAHDTVVKIETTIDDMNPQVFESLFDRVYEQGAKEVYLQHIIAKKSRPAFVLTVLCDASLREGIRESIFAHTTTFGIRYQEYTRDKVPSRFVYKKTPLGKVKFRVSDGPVVKAVPEYEECKKIAQQKKMSLIEVYRLLT